MIRFLKAFKEILFFSSQKRSLIIYSENKFYHYHFKDLVTYLSKKHKVTYLTSDKSDDFFKNYKNVEWIFIGKSIIKYFYLSTLNCNCFITTLTDFGKNILRSKNCNNYVYFFHALASTHKIYKFEAFKYYDHILCVGPYQKKELRVAEQKFGFKKKNIENTGYFYLDFLENNVKKKIPSENSVLFAPSWNYSKENLFKNFGFILIDLLIKNKIKVIFRPHPEIIKRNKKQFESIIKKYKCDKFFKLDLKPSNLESMQDSEVLITDNSTISIEYLFVIKRPVIFINFKEKIHNAKFKDLNIEPFEEIVKKKFGYNLDISEISNIKKHFYNAKRTVINLKSLSTFKKKNIYNLGSSAEFAEKFYKKIS